MAVIIAMLRGVNVGGHNMIKMEELRALCKSLKLRDACTYVQSGNLIFRTEERDLEVLAKRLQNAIERKFGFRPDVVLRTAAEMREVIARNPFAKRREVEPNRLLVTFLASEPAADARDKASQLETAPEELRMDRREVYIYFPNGMARPKVSWPTIERILKTSGTGRNWNSVTKMLEMAEKLETSE
ncbi:MAG: DUF1697 domain-containing protein [Candidatus Acidiferrales bacterium]